MLTYTKVLLLTIFCLTAKSIDYKNKNTFDLSDLAPQLMIYSSSQKFLLGFDWGQRNLRIYDGHSLNQIQLIQFLDSRWIDTAQFSHNQQFLAVAVSGSDVDIERKAIIYLYGRQGSAFTNTPIWTQTIPGQGIPFVIAFSNNDKKIAIGNHFDGLINIFDTPAINHKLAIQNGYQFAGQSIKFDNVLNDLVFTAQGNLFAGGEVVQNGIIKLFDASNKWAEIQVIKYPQLVLSLALSSDGSFLLSTGKYPYPSTLPAQITTWDAKKFILTGALALPPGKISTFYQIQISHNMLYAAAQGDSTVMTWQRNSTADRFTKPTVIYSIMKYTDTSLKTFSKKGDTILIIPQGTKRIYQYSLCLNGTFYSQDLNQCVDCMLTGCQDCVNLSICITCFANFRLNQNGKCQSSNDNAFPDRNKFTICVQPCQTCKSSTACTSCIQGYTLQNEACNKKGISFQKSAHFLLRSLYQHSTKYIRSIAQIFYKKNDQ